MARIDRLKSRPVSAPISPSPKQSSIVETLPARDYATPAFSTTSYYSPELIQCTLPHSDPKTRDWIRTNGQYSLIISSGIDSKGTVYGVPYGSFPRLLLAYVITQVVDTHKRQVELSSHFGSFLREIGYTGNLRGNTIPAQRIKNQLNRLLNARITFEYQEGTALVGRLSVRNVDIATKYDLWWDFKNPQQGSLFESSIMLSEDFHRAILAAPVPLKTEILKSLRKSPLAIDVYMWVSYRLFGMQVAGQKSITVPYSGLQAQFGTGIADENYRQFKSRLKEAFEKVGEHWRPETNADDRFRLNYTFTEEGLLLANSPLLIGRDHRLTDREIAAEILRDRKFDTNTHLMAYTIAGKWSTKQLEKMYFAWLDDTGTVPKNPRSHFLRFVKTHIAKNGSAPS